MPGPYSSRADEIRALRRRVPKYRVPFPSLACPSGAAPCSNTLVYTADRIRAFAHPDAATFPIGHNHKQSLEMLTPAMMSQLQWLGGKKS